MLRYFLYLLIKPTSTIKRILREKPSFKRIVVFLFCIGALRGLVEGIWLLLMKGQFSQVIVSCVLLKGYLLQGIPFVFSNVTTAYLRWVAFALTPFVLGIFFKGEGRFREFLRVYGVILGIFLVTILPNFAHLFLRLPLIQFNVSKVYNPAIGVGQMITSCWLAFISYKVVRILHKLPRFEAVFIGLSVPLINIGSLVFGAMVLFNLPSLTSLSQSRVFSLSTLGFTAVILLAIPVLLWVGYKIDRKRQRRTG